MVYPYQLVATFGISFLLGVLVASYLSVAIPLLMVGAFLFAALLLFKPSLLVKVAAVFGLGLLLGWWRFEAAASLPNNLISNWAGQTILVEGKVASDPEPFGNQQRFHLRVEQADGQPATGKILLTTWPLPSYAYGDELAAKIELTHPPILDDFDYATYLAKDGIYALGRSVDDVTLLRRASLSLLGSLYQFRHWLSEKINQFLPTPHNTLLNSLLLGLRAQLPDDLKQHLRGSGTSHIVALSGLHIMIVAGIFSCLLRRAPRRISSVSAAVGVLFFILMTGAKSSAIRAGIMGWVMLLAVLWGRRRDATNAVIMAAVIITVLNPYAPQYDVGFQLSVAATLGLIFFTPHLIHWFRYLPAVIKETAAATVGATFATLPLIAFHFGGFSTTTLLANILVVPLISTAMILGLGLTLLFALLPFMQIFNFLVLIVTGWIIGIIDFFGGLSYSFVAMPPLSPIWPVAYYLVTIIIFYYFTRVRVRHS